MNKKKIFLKFNYNYKKNLNLKVVDKNKNFNLFFNLGNSDDDLYYLFFDVLNWDSNDKWIFFSPYTLSFFFKLKENKQWHYIRLLNIVNKKIKNNNILNINNFLEYWFVSNIFCFKNLLNKFFTFKKKVIFFNFNYYYLYYNHLDFYFFYSLNFINKKYFYLKRLPINKNIFIEIFSLIKFKIKNNFIKKNNNKYLILNFINYKFFFINYKILERISWFYFFIKYSHYSFLNFKKNFWFIHIIEGKHKIKNFNYFKKFIYFKYSRKNFFILRKLLYKRRLRKKRNENFIFLKTKKLFELFKFRKNRIFLVENKIYVKLKKKRRTKNRIFFQNNKKNFFFKHLFFILLSWKNKKSLNLSFFKNKNIQGYSYMQIRKKYIFFDITFCYKELKKYFFSFVNKNDVFFDLDVLYVRFLCKRLRLISRFLPDLTDESVNLWIPDFFTKNSYDYFNLYTKNLIFDSTFFSVRKLKKINIKNIYVVLLSKKKSYIFFYNFFLSSLFFNKYKNFFVKNLDFFFDLYFWIIIFLKLVKKSLLINIKKIINYYSFVKIINFISKNNLNWFNIQNFELSLRFITKNNLIYNLKCDFYLILQEACLFLFYNLLNITGLKFNSNVNELKLNLLNLKNFKNIKYVFKGYLNLENNYIYCLDFIKKYIDMPFFFNLIRNFFLYCSSSVLFIKNFFKFYLILLNLTYSTLDIYIINFLKDVNLKKNFYYIRYNNLVLLCCNLDNKYILNLLLQNIYIFFFCFLKIYFIFIIIYNLNKQNVDILNYVLYKKKKYIGLTFSIVYILKLFIFFNFLKIKKNKLFIKPANFLLNFSLGRIFDFFFNIWNEIFYSFCFLKNINLKILYNILYKACFLTMSLKLKNKNKNFNFLIFKKFFKFTLLFNNNKINLNQQSIIKYLLKTNTINLKYILSKSFF